MKPTQKHGSDKIRSLSVPFNWFDECWKDKAAWIIITRDTCLEVLLDEI